MQVKVVSISEPVLDEIKTPDDIIAYTARVSNPTNQNNTETAPRLIKYLKKHKHWSPFEMAHVVIEINTTRDIARQILRHRSFSFQEFSQRYADPSVMGDMFETRECRLQDEKNRQNSVEIDQTDEYEGGLSDRWHGMQERVIREAEMVYKWALDNGIAKEQARAVLPEGLTKSPPQETPTSPGSEELPQP